MRFPVPKQRRMDHLIQSSKRRSLSPTELKELDKLLDDVFVCTLKLLESRRGPMAAAARNPPPRRRRAASAA